MRQEQRNDASTASEGVNPASQLARRPHNNSTTPNHLYIDGLDFCIDFSAMAFAIHPMMSTYPGASFFPNGNLNGPHLAMRSGGNNPGYWGHVPWEVPEMTPWGLPPAITAAMEGRGTGVYGMTMQGPGAPFNYGWPKYGPMPLKPELGGFYGKLNPFGRSWPHGFYKTLH